jgi:D-alanine transaminase
MADPLLVNGRLTTTGERFLSVDDRGLQYGDALYEVIKFTRRRTLFAREHFERLAEGLGVVEIPLPWRDFDEFLASCITLIEQAPYDDGLVYVQVSRGEAPRAHVWPEGLKPSWFACTMTALFPDAEKKRRGIPVITTGDERGTLCHLKSVNLLPMALAKKKAQRAGAEEALWIRDHHVTEGASSNFFAVSKGRLVTHPAGRLILSGTVRDRVISIAIADRIRVDERPVHENELLGIDEAFITATSRGVMPVTSIDGRPVGSGERGEVTLRLQELFDAAERDESGS